MSLQALAKPTSLEAIGTTRWQTEISLNPVADWDSLPELRARTSVSDDNTASVGAVEFSPALGWFPGPAAAMYAAWGAPRHGYLATMSGASAEVLRPRYNVGLTAGTLIHGATSFELPSHLTLGQGEFLASLSRWGADPSDSTFLLRLDSLTSSSISILGPSGEERAAATRAESVTRRFSQHYDEILEWLGLTTAEMKVVTGIGRSTRFYWREGDPRPSTGRRLEQVHALVRSIVDALGPANARAWFASGSPSGVDLLVAHDYAGLSSRAHSVVFATAETAALQRLAEQVERVDDDDTGGTTVSPPEYLQKRRRSRKRMASDDR
jgi:hypothetical protein